MGIYKDEIANMVWSYSRLTSFEHCQYEFYLNYIVKDSKTYLSESNFYAEVGSFVHEVLEMIFKGELSYEDAAIYFLDHYKEKIFYKTKRSIMHNTIMACAEYFANEDFEWLKKYEILGVEKECKFEIEGYNFVGYIDLLVRDKSDGKIVVIDNKSSEYPFKQNGEVKAKSKENFEKYKKQMYLYSHCVFLEYGEYPKSIVWNHFKDGGKFAKIPFLKAEYDEAIKWMVNTIHRIESENEYNPNQNYFYCKNLCNFRNSCDYRVKDKRK